MIDTFSLKILRWGWNKKLGGGGGGTLFNTNRLPRASRHLTIQISYLDLISTVDVMLIIVFERLDTNSLLKNHRKHATD